MSSKPVSQSGSEEKLAVALEYEEGSEIAPRVTAKGTGDVAERIIELARDHDVMIEGNPALAQALSAVELDEHVPEHLFTAVAAIIAFVLKEADKKRQSPFAEDQG